MSIAADISVGEEQALREGPGRDAITASRCLHCELPLGAGAEDGFCCGGCRAVYRLIRAEGLERYYDLRTGAGNPVPELRTEHRDRKWLEPLEQQLASVDGTAATHLSLDVQGIHCTACVWLMQKLFDREEGGVRALVNPAVGRVELAVQPGFDLRHWVQEVERFGYLLGPALKEGSSKSDDLLLRMGICIALAGNSMLFAAAIYLGLSEGPLFELMHQLQYALAAVSVLVGGSVFISGAWRALRRGMLHLDLPIALGIVLAFAGSSWSFFFETARASYFDSVAVFIALMLVGRWMQERVLERNRRQLLASDGVDGLLARRVRDGAVALVPCREIEAGDELLVAPGDLVPVDAVLAEDEARCSLDWINGESAPRRFTRGQTLPAGAFNLGSAALTARAATGFDRSPLTTLLRSPARAEKDEWGASEFWQRFSRIYVVLVLLAAGAGLVGWAASTGDVVRALEVATAILVVTCPCAFGIATPLAYELVQGGLRRAGLFVRSSTFLDRARDVRRVVFDKTGTLTTGTLGLEAPSVLDGLAADDRQALYDLAARSAHPKSLAVKRALDRYELAIRPGVAVTEHPGQGLEATIDGHLHRLGSARWVGASDDADLVYACDGEVRALLRTEERLRPDATREIARLRDGGYDLWVLSGDEPGKVRDMATSLGLGEERGVGGQSPVGKAEWLESHDHHDTLMLGDGINDGLAVDRAFVSGTPAVDRPFMPARSDFYVTTPGLGPVTLALRAASALAQTVRRNLAFAVAYNLIAVALAMAGLMEPWLAAVLMPTSSLVILAATSAQLSRRSALWKS